MTDLLGFRPEMGKPRKYNWPDDIDIIRELDDETLLKLWQYAPRATEAGSHEAKCSFVLCDELVDRGLK